LDTRGTSLDLRKQIKQHYLNRFGRPSREAEFEPKKGPIIEVWKWSENQTREGVCIYATIGAYAALSKNTKSCEFFIGLTPAADGIASALADVALNGVENKKKPSFGDTVTLKQTLWPETSIKTFLFTSGGSEIIEPLVGSTFEVDYIQLVPLYPAELDYKKKYGEDALWERFEQLQTPYWLSSRTSSFSIDTELPLI